MANMFAGLGPIKPSKEYLEKAIKKHKHEKESVEYTRAVQALEFHYQIKTSSDDKPEAPPSTGTGTKTGTKRRGTWTEQGDENTRKKVTTVSTTDRKKNETEAKNHAKSQREKGRSKAQREWDRIQAEGRRLQTKANKDYYLEKAKARRVVFLANRAAEVKLRHEAIREVRIRNARIDQKLKVISTGKPAVVNTDEVSKLIDKIIRQVDLRAMIPQLLNISTSKNRNEFLIDPKLEKSFGNKILRLAKNQRRMYTTYLDSLSGILENPNLPMGVSSHRIVARMETIGNAGHNSRLFPAVDVHWTPLSKTTKKLKKAINEQSYWKHTGVLAKAFKQAVSEQKASFGNSKVAEPSFINIAAAKEAISKAKLESINTSGRSRMELNFNVELMVPGWRGKDSALMDDLITKPYMGIKPNTPFSHLDKASARAEARARKSLRGQGNPSRYDRELAEINKKLGKAGHKVPDPRMTNAEMDKHWEAERKKNGKALAWEVDHNPPVNADGNVPRSYADERSKLDTFSPF